MKIIYALLLITGILNVPLYCAKKPKKLSPDEHFEYNRIHNPNFFLDDQMRENRKFLADIKIREARENRRFKILFGCIGALIVMVYLKPYHYLPKLFTK